MPNAAPFAVRRVLAEPCDQAPYVATLYRELQQAGTNPSDVAPSRDDPWSEHELLRAKNILAHEMGEGAVEASLDTIFACVREGYATHLATLRPNKRRAPGDPRRPTSATPAPARAWPAPERAMDWVDSAQLERLQSTGLDVLCRIDGIDGQLFARGPPRDPARLDHMCSHARTFLVAVERMVQTLHGYGRAACPEWSPTQRWDAEVERHGHDIMNCAGSSVWWYCQVFSPAHAYLRMSVHPDPFRLPKISDVSNGWESLLLPWRAMLSSVKTLFTTCLSGPPTTAASLLRQAFCESRTLEGLLPRLRRAGVSVHAMRADPDDSWSESEIRSAWDLFHRTYGVDPELPSGRLNPSECDVLRDALFRSVAIRYEVLDRPPHVPCLPPVQLRDGQLCLRQGTSSTQRLKLGTVRSDSPTVEAWARSPVPCEEDLHCMHAKSHHGRCEVRKECVPLSELVPLEANEWQKPIFDREPTAYLSLQSLKFLAPTNARRVYAMLPLTDARAAWHDGGIRLLCVVLRDHFPAIWAVWRTRSASEPEDPSIEDTCPEQHRLNRISWRPASESGEASGQDGKERMAKELRLLHSRIKRAAPAASSSSSAPSSSDATVVGRFAVFRSSPIFVTSISVDKPTYLSFEFIDASGHRRTDGRVAYSTKRDRESFHAGCDHVFLESRDAFMDRVAELFADAAVVDRVRETWPRAA